MRIRTAIIGLFVALSAADPPSGICLPVCKTRELSIQQDSGGLAMGLEESDFVLTNRSTHACTLFGYPSATALTKSGEIARGFNFEHEPALAAAPDNLRPKVIRLSPGAKAWFMITSRDGTGMEDLSLCGASTQVEVTPPGSTHAFPRRFSFGGCTTAQGITFLLPGLP